MMLNELDFSLSEREEERKQPHPLLLFGGGDG